MESNHAIYSEVLWPDRPVVLGVPLEPVTIGQALLLWRLKSPFIGAGALPPKDGDIVTALYVLSRPCREAATELRASRVPPAFGGWCQDVALLAEADKVGAREQIDTHVATAFAGPATWSEQKEKPDQQPGAPLLAALKVRLMEVFGLSREEAMDYPVREALWDIAVHGEVNGHLRLVSAADSAAVAAAAEIEPDADMLAQHEAQVKKAVEELRAGGKAHG